MAAIRGKDTRPERIVRSGLHRAGFRFRLHHKDLPGRPDIVLAKHRAVVLVHGCFWHGHGCVAFRLPSGPNAAFWKAKIARNRERDAEVAARLAGAGWRRLVIWECAVTGKRRRDAGELIAATGDWLRSQARTGEIAGGIAPAPPDRSDADA